MSGYKLHNLVRSGNNLSCQMVTFSVYPTFSFGVNKKKAYTLSMKQNHIFVTNENYTLNPMWIHTI